MPVCFCFFSSISYQWYIMNGFLVALYLAFDNLVACFKVSFCYFQKKLLIQSIREVPFISLYLSLCKTIVTVTGNHVISHNILQIMYHQWKPYFRQTNNTLINLMLSVFQKYFAATSLFCICFYFCCPLKNLFWFIQFLLKITIRGSWNNQKLSY